MKQLRIICRISLNSSRPISTYLLWRNCKQMPTQRPVCPSRALVGEERTPPIGFLPTTRWALLYSSIWRIQAERFLAVMRHNYFIGQGKTQGVFLFRYHLLNFFRKRCVGWLFGRRGPTTLFSPVIRKEVKPIVWKPFASAVGYFWSFSPVRNWYYYYYILIEIMMILFATCWK